MDNGIKGFSNYTGIAGYIPDSGSHTSNQPAFGPSAMPANQGSYLGNLQNPHPYSSLARQNIATRTNVQSLLTPASSNYGAVGASGYSGTGGYPPYQAQGGYLGAGSYALSSSQPQFGYSGTGAYPPYQAQGGYLGAGSYAPSSSQPQFGYSGTGSYPSQPPAVYTESTASYQPRMPASAPVNPLPISTSASNQAAGVSQNYSYPMAAQAFAATGGYSGTLYPDNSAGYIPFSQRHSGSSAIPRTIAATYKPPVSAPTQLPVGTSASHQGTGSSIKKLCNGVTLALCKNGVFSYVTRFHGKYCLLTTVDPGLRFDCGVAEKTVQVLGANYRIQFENKENKKLLTKDRQAIPYDFRDRKAPALLKGIEQAYTLCPPAFSEQDSQKTLKESLATLLISHAMDEKMQAYPIIASFIGAGDGGWSGSSLARVLFDARCHADSQLKDMGLGGMKLPELTLVGMNTPKDMQFAEDFAKEWTGLTPPEEPKLNKAHPQATPDQAVSHSPAPNRRNLAPQVPATVVSPIDDLGCTHTKTLIPGFLYAALHPKGGIFGVGEALSKKGKTFDLVNAANQYMNHHGGIAKAFVGKFEGKYGRSYSDVTAEALKHNRIVPGKCLPINLAYWDLQPQPAAKLDGCENIYNVVAPIKKDYSPKKYNDAFKETCVSLLDDAYKNGGNIVASSFFGCGIFGGNGTLLAKAFYDACFDDQIKPLLSMMPPIVFVGMDTASCDDLNVYNDFIKEFERLNGNKPVDRSPGNAGYSSSVSGAVGGAKPKQRLSVYSGAGAASAGIQATPGPVLPSPPPAESSTSSSSVTRKQRAKTKRQPGHTQMTLMADASESKGGGRKASPAGTKAKSGIQQMGRMGSGLAGMKFEDAPAVPRWSEKYLMATGVTKTSESAATKFTGGGKVIDCGICLESKPEKDSQLVSGTKVCSDCAIDYQDTGVNLDSVATLDEEYAAINYKPLRISTEQRDLPGFPGAGRIVVGIEATAPHCLSDGRKLSITNKTHNHYLPNNELGNELLHLLKILHEEKLIYKIDQSNTLGHFGITFNFHLKTADYGGEVAHGYPDVGYPARALNEISGLAATHGLGEKLNTSKLIKLIQEEAEKTKR